ncbi:MAG: heparan-alpha-glucosaminide N-acetyltransferase domain-containing protein, partial [Rhodoferax sp.]|nr:heparan-alpha-glucosaminide N-acetyltransferase domain-containing protein [Rhodoferax sp.]
MLRKSPSLSSSRFEAVDAVRGLAMVWMTVFHFCFDLNHFGYWRQDFYRDPFWTWQRTLILSLFLFSAGVGQAIAVAQGQSWTRFWRRWAQVAGCALLVTLGSWLMYP